MLKFRKDFNSKIISLLVAVTFLSNSTVYGIDLSNKTHLRVPSTFNDQKKTDRIKRALLELTNEALERPIMQGLPEDIVVPFSEDIPKKKIRELRQAKIKDLPRVGGFTVIPIRDLLNHTANMACIGLSEAYGETVIYWDRDLCDAFFGFEAKALGEKTPPELRNLFLNKNIENYPLWLRAAGRSINHELITIALFMEAIENRTLDGRQIGIKLTGVTSLADLRAWMRDNPKDAYELNETIHNLANETDGCDIRPFYSNPEFIARIDVASLDKLGSEFPLWQDGDAMPAKYTPNIAARDSSPPVSHNFAISLVPVPESVEALKDGAEMQQALISEADLMLDGESFRLRRDLSGKAILYRTTSGAAVLVPISIIFGLLDTDRSSDVSFSEFMETLLGADIELTQVTMYYQAIFEVLDTGDETGANWVLEPEEFQNIQNMPPELAMNILDRLLGDAVGEALALGDFSLEELRDLCGDAILNDYLLPLLEIARVEGVYEDVSEILSDIILEATTWEDVRRAEVSFRDRLAEGVKDTPYYVLRGSVEILWEIAGTGQLSDFIIEFEKAKLEGAAPDRFAAHILRHSPIAQANNGLQLNSFLCLVRSSHERLRLEFLGKLMEEWQAVPEEEFYISGLCLEIRRQLAEIALHNVAMLRPDLTADIRGNVVVYFERGDIEFFNPDNSRLNPELQAMLRTEASKVLRLLDVKSQKRLTEMSHNKTLEQLEIFKDLSNGKKFLADTLSFLEGLEQEEPMDRDEFLYQLVSSSYGSYLVHLTYGYRIEGGVSFLIKGLEDTALAFRIVKADTPRDQQGTFIIFEKPLDSEYLFQCIQIDDFSRAMARSMKVLLVNPARSAKEAEKNPASLSLHALASAATSSVFTWHFLHGLKKRWYTIPDRVPVPEITVVNATLEQARELVRSINPDVVGVTATTAYWPLAQKILENAKAVKADVMTIAGGVHASALPFQCLEEAPLDMVCMDRGEESFTEAMYNMAHHQNLEVQGAIVKTESGTPEFYTPRKYPVVRDLSRYPHITDTIPDSQKAASLKKPFGRKFRSEFVIHHMGSEGCPFLCKNCSTGRRIGIRYRDAQDVVDELEDFYYDPTIKSLERDRNGDITVDDVRYREVTGARTFVLLDDMFTLKRERVLEFLDELEHRNMEIEFAIVTRADDILRHLKKAPDFLERLRKAGCLEISIGVEGSRADIEEINKKLDLNHVRTLTKMAKELDIKVQHYYMTGIPGQSWDNLTQAVLFFLGDSSFDDGTEDSGTKRITQLMAMPPPELIAEFDLSVRPTRGSRYPMVSYPQIVYATDDRTGVLPGVDKERFWEYELARPSVGEILPLHTLLHFFNSDRLTNAEIRFATALLEEIDLAKDNQDRLIPLLGILRFMCIKDKEDLAFSPEIQNVLKNPAVLFDEVAAALLLENIDSPRATEELHEVLGHIKRLGYDLAMTSDATHAGWGYGVQLSQEILEDYTSRVTTLGGNYAFLLDVYRQHALSSLRLTNHFTLVNRINALNERLGIRGSLLLAPWSYWLFDDGCSDERFEAIVESVEALSPAEIDPLASLVSGFDNILEHPTWIHNSEIEDRLFELEGFLERSKGDGDEAVLAQAKREKGLGAVQISTETAVGTSRKAQPGRIYEDSEIFIRGAATIKNKEHLLKWAAGIGDGNVAIVLAMDMAQYKRIAAMKVEDYVEIRLVAGRDEVMDLEPHLIIRFDEKEILDLGSVFDLYGGGIDLHTVEDILDSPTRETLRKA